MRPPPALALPALLLAGGCVLWSTTLPPGPRAPQVRPTRDIEAKEQSYRDQLERFHANPDGLVDYAVPIEPVFDAVSPIVPRPRIPPLPPYGRHSDVAHFTGIALAAESFRFATLRTPEAREAVATRLRGLELLEAVTGVPGLLARHASPEPVADGVPVDPGPKWQRAAAPYESYVWRDDVSKDQLAGVAFGLGVLLAVVDDPALHTRGSALAARIVDHMRLNDMVVYDSDGEPTEYGNLNGYIFGVPIGVNALISLALFKAAAVGTGDVRYEQAYAELVDEGYPRAAQWAHFAVFGFYKPTNDHMAWLGLYPLLRLERDPELLNAYRDAADALDDALGWEENAFYDASYASAYEGDVQLSPQRRAAVQRARTGLLRSLEDFPERKVPLPVDLTDRPELARRWLNDLDGTPRAARAIPLYLRPIKTNMWSRPAADLIGNEREKGDELYVGYDFLLPYWMARYYRLLPAPAGGLP